MPVKGKSLTIATQADIAYTTPMPFCEGTQLPLWSAIAASALRSNGEASGGRSPTSDNSKSAPGSSLAPPEASTGREKDSSPHWSDFISEISSTIVVAQRDRLARFGFELIQWLVQQNGNAVLVLNQQDGGTESELTQDLLAVLHTFSCRVRGLRRYRAAIAQDKTLSHNPAEADAQDLAGRQPLGL